ncbi:hypothetical protein [Archangium sp.]|uniref:RCC1-like domain-containing protein n=1 Tax=Archangium sp. TaxID=1872627 RepID=UPI002D65FF93|nr:hypothetical protein [Archangium sp.]HYO52440.1 hypothetical protein [Archangium sp.]
MKAPWMALLSVALVTGCGGMQKHQSQQPASPPPLNVTTRSQHLTEDGATPGLPGRAWDSPLRGVLAAGSFGHTLALDANGTVWAWGNNAYGQLGDGTTRERPLPVELAGTERVKFIVAGTYHTLALREDGTVWGWGNNSQGQLGRPASTNPEPTPVQVPGLTGMVALAAGSTHSLALREDGTVWAWGNNRKGQLGRPASTNPEPTPAQVPDLTGVVALAAGSTHSLALREDGTVWGWGSNGFGQLGFPSNTSPNPTPAQVPGLTGVGDVAASNDFSLALREDGTVWAWGFNAQGQLGDGTSSTSRSTPRPVEGLKHVLALAAGARPLAMSKDGTVWGWGWNDSGALGTGTNIRATPVQVRGLTSTVTVSVGSDWALAVREDGTVWGWGNNNFGQLGDGTSAMRATPVRVQGLSDGVAIATGDYHALALRKDGTVWAWGFNQFGQLGDGTTTHRTAPVQVTGLSGVVAIGAARFYSLALREDGTVWFWGANWQGVLGRPPSYDPNPTPTQVTGLTNVVALAAGYTHALALR